MSTAIRSHGSAPAARTKVHTSRLAHKRYVLNSSPLAPVEPPRSLSRNCHSLARSDLVTAGVEEEQAVQTAELDPDTVLSSIISPSAGPHCAIVPSGTVGTDQSAANDSLSLLSTEDFDPLVSLDLDVRLEVTGQLPPEAVPMPDDMNPYTTQDALSVPVEGLGGEPELEALLAEGGAELSVARIERIFPFPLDNFQRKAVQKMLEGKSVVVCAPTGAGKTAIAEGAAAATLARGQRVIYTTPLKALSNQKLAEGRIRFGQQRCGLQTGDASLNTDAPIVIMTTEILRNIMYRTAEQAGPSGEGGATREGRLGDVGLVILDEVHYLGDPQRGSVWEELIINCPRHIQLLAMSATVQNPQDLGGWISQEHGECETVMTRFRPVPLHWLFCYQLAGRVQVEPLLDKSGKRLNKALLNTKPTIEDAKELLSSRRSPPGETSQAFGLNGMDPQQLRTLMRRNPERVERMLAETRVPSMDKVVMMLRKRDMLPAIWFILSRRDCDLSAIRLAQRIILTTEEEQEQIQEAIDTLYADQPDAVRERVVDALRSGIAVHHAGTLPGWKALVERLFQRGLVKLVFATGTLAAGINMPARATILSAVSRKTDDGIEMFPHNELLQMAGRAGRRGYDQQGFCVVLQTKFDGASAAYSIISKGPEPLQSRFGASYGLVLNLLSTYTLEEAREFVSRSFGAYMGAGGNARRKNEILALEAQAAAIRERMKSSSSQEVTNLMTDIRTSQQRLRELRLTELNEQCRAVALALGAVGTPCCVLLGLGREGDGQSTVQVPAWVVGFIDELPLKGGAGGKGMAFGPFVECLTYDNRLLKMSVHHILGVLKGSSRMLTQTDQEELRRVIDKIGPKSWSNLTAGMFSCQTAPGTTATATVALQLPSSIPYLDNEDLLLAEVQPQLTAELQATRKIIRKKVRQLDVLRRTEQRVRASQEAANATALPLVDDVDAPSASGDQMLLAKKLTKRAEALKAEMQAATEGTWLTFLDVMEILKEFQALEDGTLRVLPLGLAARSFQAQNELWLALVLSSPALMGLNGPQLAGLLGSVLSGEVNRFRTPGGVGFTASAEVQQALSVLEPQRELLFELQSEFGLSKWNDALRVDLRMGGMVEAWAGGATWSEVLGDSDMDDGDAARLLIRTNDMLRQVLMSSEMLPWLRGPAMEALKFSDRKPVSELVV